MLHYIVAVEGAVYKNNRYLMTLRSENETHAPDTLAFPGGKVENAFAQQRILEKTLQREIMEETGVSIEDEMVYIESKSFTADDGDPVVDMVFLCRYKDGEAIANEPEEICQVIWLTCQEILDHPKTPPWGRACIQAVEKVRQYLRWE